MLVEKMLLDKMLLDKMLVDKMLVDENVGGRIDLEAFWLPK
jgi:hypothetical protein